MIRLKYLVFGILLSGFVSTGVLASVPNASFDRAFADSHDQPLANDERKSLAPIQLARETSTTTTTTKTKEKIKTNDGQGNKSKTKTTTTTTTTTTSDDTDDNSGENSGSRGTGASYEGW